MIESIITSSNLLDSQEDATSSSTTLVSTAGTFVQHTNLPHRCDTLEDPLAIELTPQDGALEDPASEHLIPPPSKQVTLAASTAPPDCALHPQILPRNRTSLGLALATESLLLLISSCFFVFAHIVLAYNGKPVEGHEKAKDTLMRAARLGPTIFPILFAAVIGRLMKHLMAWRLEVGEKLGLLDLLAGSTTVAGTITTQFQLGVPSLIGVALVIVWLLSPIGGQASLRVLGIESFMNRSTIPAKDLSNNYTYEAYFGSDLGAVQTLIFGSFYAALLGTPRVKSSPVDVWNNVKIPAMESLTTVSTDAWLAVPESPELVYSSLVGLPLWGLPAGMNNTIYIETSYLLLDCQRLGNVPEPHGLSLSLTTLYDGGSHANWSGTRVRLESSSMLSNGTGGTTKSGCGVDMYDETIAPRYIAYNAYNADQTRFGALCSIRTSYVEVEIKCAGQDCRSKNIRRSTLDNPTPNWSIFDGREHGEGCRWFTYSSQLFLRSITANRSGTSTPLQGYLTDPYSPDSPHISTNVSDMDRDIVALRFAQLLNTFMLVCAGPTAVPYGLKADNYDASTFPSHSILTSASSTRTFQIMVCHIWWLAILLVVSSLLVAANIWAIVLRFKRITPELALNWSTAVRDNPHVNMAGFRSFMDDSDRSKTMRNTRLMFGAGAADEVVKHLAIRSMDVDGEIERARRDTLYD